MTDPYPTQHLLEKMKNRDISWGDVLAVMEDADVVYGPDHKGRYVHQKGNLSVVATREGAVITALLRVGDAWNDQKARERERCEGEFDLPLYAHSRCDHCGRRQSEHI